MRMSWVPGVVQPRDIVHASILLSFGALLVGGAAWVISLGLGSGGPDSALPPLIILGGLVVLGVGLLLVGGAAADTVWAWRERWRYKRSR
jgi:hypothetical protein